MSFDRHSVWRKSRRIGRLAFCGALAGLVAGLVAGGVGSRLAMRIVALAAGHELYGVKTDADAVVGTISLEGSLFLFSAGAFLGIPFGVGFVAIRRLLPGRSDVRRGLAYGAILLAVFGDVVIEGDNRDFRIFVSPYLAVGLFATLPIVYGLLLGGLTGRFAPIEPDALPRRWITVPAWSALALVCAFGVTSDLQQLREIFA